MTHQMTRIERPHKGRGWAAAAVLAFCLQGCSDGEAPPGPPSSCPDTPCTITGTTWYEDRAADSNGFTGSKDLKPIRFADTELVRNSDGAVLATTNTDAAGAFSITFTNTGTAGVYVRVLSRTADASVKVEVKHSSGALYALTSGILDDAASTSLTASLTAMVPSTGSEEIGGAFHILDQLVEGSEFIRGLSGLPYQSYQGGRKCQEEVVVTVTEARPGGSWPVLGCPGLFRLPFRWPF